MDSFEHALTVFAQREKGRGKAAKLEALSTVLCDRGLLRPRTIIPPSLSLSSRTDGVTGPRTVGHWLLVTAPGRHRDVALYGKSPDDHTLRRLAEAVMEAAREPPPHEQLTAHREAALEHASEHVYNLGKIIRAAREHLESRAAGYQLDPVDFSGYPTEEEALEHAQLRVKYGSTPHGYTKLYAAFMSVLDELKHEHHRLHEATQELHDLSTDEGERMHGTGAAMATQRSLRHAREQGKFMQRATQLASDAKGAAKSARDDAGP